MHDLVVRSLEDAFGRTAIELGDGGPIPPVAVFGEAALQAEIVLVGVADPESRPHISNESIHLGEFERTTVAETLFLHRLAPGGDAGT